MPRDAVEFVRATAARASGLAGSGHVRSLDALVAARGDAHAALPAPALSRDQLAGRVVELSALGASTALSTMALVLRDVQASGDPAAWIGPSSSSFFPPDLAARGIDLRALVVVRTSPLAGAAPRLRAAERLLRSGGFGLVIIDGGRDFALPLATQGRLAGLAQQHDAILLLLTEKSVDATSAGAMVSLRLDTTRRRDRSAGMIGGSAAMRCVAHALKDKRRGPGWELASLLAARPGG